MANTYLTRTFGTPTDTKKYTMSVWVKRSKLGVQQSIARSTNGNDDSHLFTFNSDDTLRWDEYGSSSSIGKLVTNRKFRDTNAFYHVVLKWDTTNSTASDRMKMWINGVEETSFSTDTNPSLNAISAFNKASQPINIGRTSYGSGGNYFEGVLSHFHFTDGYAYDASAFGSTDATTGEWKINTSPSVTYGTNGFFVLKDGNSGTDQSGNSNNWTVGGGTLTKTEDCPDNVFCTLSPLHKLGTNTGTYSNGNTKYADANSNWQGTMCTLGATSGKYYWEYQLVAGTYHMVGIMPDNVNLSSSSVFDTIGGYSAYIDNGYIEARYNNADISGWSKSDLGNTTFSTNDYINLAVDMDNKFMYIGKNGTWLKSADPTSGATGTGGINVSATFTSGVFMIPVISAYSGTTGQFNFGNGYMGTTAVASAGTNASGIGIFEHDVPNGYTSLSTKGLNL